MCFQKKVFNLLPVLSSESDDGSAQIKCMASSPETEKLQFLYILYLSFKNYFLLFYYSHLSFKSYCLNFPTCCFQSSWLSACQHTERRGKVPKRYNQKGQRERREVECKTHCKEHFGRQEANGGVTLDQTHGVKIMTQVSLTVERRAYTKETLSQ